MVETTKPDQIFHLIMKRMVETGQAPHYTEIATESNISMENGRRAMHELFGAGIPAIIFGDVWTRTGFPAAGSMRGRCLQLSVK